jgi:cytochrome c oxidase subunit 2
MSIREAFFLPPVISAHGHEIDFQIYLVHALMFLLFIGWGIYFFIAIFKFSKRNNPKANYEGVKSHFSSVIEVAVVIFEAILLIGFSIPFWVKQVNALPERPDTLNVKIIAEQFAWNIHYPGNDGIFGKADVKYFDKQTNPLGLDPNDPNGKDDIHSLNQLYLPVGRPVVMHLTSRDVMHSLFLPEARVKQDVIPGMSIPTWFTPTKTGNYEIACAQLCGLGHYRMKGFLNILSQEDYDKWIQEQASSSGEGEGQSDDFWN